MTAKRALLLTNMLTPYRAPLLRHVSAVLAGRGWEFKVLTLSERESDRQWETEKGASGFDHEVAPGFELSFGSRTRTHVNRGVFRALWRYAPDVVVAAGYVAPAYWQALMYCMLTGKKFVLWSGTTSQSAGPGAGLRGFLKRMFVRGADGFIAYGAKAKEYLESIGARPETVKVSLNTVDMAFFRDRTREYREGAGFMEERARYPECLILYSGQLIARKGVREALAALKKLDDPDIGLLIVGAGPLEAELKAYCAERGLASVYFKGFCQKEELPRYYALADALVLPSLEEVWGLVVNEALAAGHFALCSKYAGAGYDLIDEGKNGALIDPADVDGFAGGIRLVKGRLDDIRERRETISLDAVARFGLTDSARAIADTVLDVWGRG